MDETKSPTLVRRYGALTSSIDPTQLSVTVQSLARVVAGLLITLGVFTTADATTILNQIPQIITTVLAVVPLAYSLWNSGEVIFGIFRKIIVTFSKKW